MTATHADQIIAGYLKRLEGELAGFPRDRRRELTAQISEHISSARAELAEETDAELLTILDRLGEPEEIATEARAGLVLPNSAPGPLEIIALLLLGVGGVVLALPPIGWVLGVGLVWYSKAWNPREKSRGAYLPLVVGLGAWLLGALAGSARGFLASTLLVAWLFALLLPLGSAIYLGSRLRRRLTAVTWIGIAVVALLVYLPAAASFLPGRTYGFVGGDGPPGNPAPRAGQTGCGAFYGTSEFASATPLTARMPVSVGICFDGQRVTKSWGPDCYPETNVLELGRVISCTAVVERDGSLLVDIQGNVTPLTAPTFASSRGGHWRITPEGKVMQFG